MNEQFQSALAPLKQFWEKTPGMVKRIVVAGAVISLIAAAAFTILLNSKDYVAIFDGLTEREATEILSKLQDMDVDVRLEGGDAILVPKEEESRVRMQLATEGYPKSGLSYYLIEENSGMLTTDYERKQYMNMQLQERIAASIKTLDGVKDAVVTITVPDDQVFYLQDKEEPSASVIIHMSGGNVLSQSQISGIQSLVAKSVQGLSVDNIALSDSQGNDLAGTALKNDPDYAKINVTREIENDLRKKINTVLLGPYQSDEFKISVTATLDTDQMVREETLYIPSEEGNNSGVISEESSEEQSGASGTGDGGVAGTYSNSEVPVYPAGEGGTGSSSTSTSEYTKYQVSQTKSQIQKSGPTIENISIGIAINKTAFDPGERESVTQLIAYATGVPAENVSVQNFRFSGSEAGEGTGGEGSAEEEGLNIWLLAAIGGGVLLLLIIGLVVLLLMKKKKKKRGGDLSSHRGKDEDGAILNEIFGHPEQEVAHIVPVPDKKREEIKDFAKENPELVAQMIKTLLRNEND